MIDAHVTVDTSNTNYQEKVQQFPHGLLDISISFYMELASEASALDLVAQGIRVIAFLGLRPWPAGNPR